MHARVTCRRADSEADAAGAMTQGQRQRGKCDEEQVSESDDDGGGIYAPHHDGGCHKNKRYLDELDAIRASLQYK